MTMKKSNYFNRYSKYSPSDIFVKIIGELNARIYKC